MEFEELKRVQTWRNERATFNPLSPSIHKQILQTDLNTFPYRISWENLFQDQSIFSWVIILSILITYLFTVYG